MGERLGWDDIVITVERDKDCGSVHSLTENAVPTFLFVTKYQILIPN